MRNDEFNMHLNLVTCFNEKNDIFKYNNKGLKLEEMNISEGFYFIRNKRNNIKKIRQQSDIKTEKGEELIFRIRKSKNNDFTIENPLNKRMPKTINNIINLNNKLWYVVKSETNENDSNNLDDYTLNKYDIIKFGSSKYEVIEKYIENCDCKVKNNNKNKYDISNFNKNSQSLFQIPEFKDADYSNKNKEIVCRICLDGESSVDNPKVRLCKCNDYIHYDCLKKWIKTKIIKKENLKKTVLSYYLKKFSCDVCLKPYLIKFKISGVNNKIYSLIDLKLPIDQNYIVLESLGLTSHNNNPKVIHIIKLIDSKITFGRNEVCDIFDYGSYVSRIQAAFKYNNQNGDVILENKSKHYDTLILVKNPIKINEKKIDFQVGRTIITANLKKKLN